MPSILVVSRQKSVTTQISGDVEELGHTTMIANDLDSAADALGYRRPDLVLLDLVECDLSPNSHWRAQLQQMPRDLPVVILLQEHGLKGFDFPPSVVDFILDPYTSAELGARINLALGLRSGSQVGNVIGRAGLQIDLDRYQVQVAGTPVDMTLKEFELLRFLVEHPGRVHTRESLMTQVWGYDYFGGTRTVDVHIRRLRSKLEPHADEYIETVRGVGYRFRD